MCSVYMVMADRTGDRTLCGRYMYQHAWMKLIKEVTPGLSIMTNNDSVLSFCVSVNLIVSNLPMLLWL